MLLNYFYLKKLPYTSAASRNVYYYKRTKLLIWKSKHLSLHIKWKAGRNSSGTTVMHSKSSFLIKLKSININYCFRYLRPSFVSHFIFVTRQNKILTLVHFSNGCLSYFNTTENYQLFSFFYLNSKFEMFGIKTIKFFSMLIKIRNLSLISLIEISPGKGAQYCRSPGVSAKILKFDSKFFGTLLRLPSGNKKLFSFYSFASLSVVHFIQNTKYLNSKAGYWRTFGAKPTVRGVAMNAVDHPHGGQTKSIRYPKTPWGKTTKFK